MKLRDKSIEGIPAETMARALQHYQHQEQIRASIRAELEALRPHFGTSNPQKAKAHADLFLETLSNRYEFEISEKGDVVLFQDGSRAENAQGWPTPLAQVVRQEAQAQFELFASDAPASTGTPIKFRDSADYMSKFYGAKSHQERALIVEAWRAQQLQTA